MTSSPRIEHLCVAFRLTRTKAAKVEARVGADPQNGKADAKSWICALWHEALPKGFPPPPYDVTFHPETQALIARWSDVAPELYDVVRSTTLDNISLMASGIQTIKCISSFDNCLFRLDDLETNCQLKAFDEAVMEALYSPLREHDNTF